MLSVSCCDTILVWVEEALVPAQLLGFSGFPLSRSLHLAGGFPQPYSGQWMLHVPRIMGDRGTNGLVTAGAGRPEESYVK